jgi:pyrroline-5-carboxylate reductase
MQLAFVGSGNMARAIALGLKEPALFSDSGSGRAQALAEATGGQAVTSAEIAQRADVIFLSHKPRQLDEVAAVLGGFSGTVVSVLAATTLGALHAAYPSATVVRTMPNLAAEFGSGVIAVAAENDDAPVVLEMLGRLGEVVVTPEEHFEVVTAVGGCAPAFFALFARDLIASAVARGMDEAQAKAVVHETLVGTGDLLRANGVDPQATMDAVASPGGLTEKALASFEQSELRAAVDRAVATVLGE